MSLDKYQEKIANDFLGEIAVVAGPGSGKTNTLIERTTRICDSGEKPQQILLISYTNKVRSEIKKRLRNKNPELEKVNVHTFHSFGVYLLRMHGSLVGINKNFEIIDDEDKGKILNKIYTELNIKKADFPVKKTLKKLETIFSEYQITFPKSNTFVDFLNSLTPNSKVDENSIIKKIFNYYTYYKRSNNYLDFDDIISYTNSLLYKEDAKRIVQNIKYVMVDEAQDLNTKQYEFIELLKNNGISNILLVGDFDQNIYSWRGARTDLFKNFYLKAKKYSLGINYRSTPAIVNYSKKLIENNTNRIEINLVSNIPSNSFTPACNFFSNNHEEMKWVSTTIKKLIKNNVSPSEIAILYRANYLSRAIEGELIKNNIQYVIYNGFEFYQRREVKDCISLLKLLVNKDDKLSLERNLLYLPNIGPKKASYILNDNVDKLSKNDKDTLHHFYDTLNKATDITLISSKLRYMIEKLNYKGLWDDGNIEDRMENYSELLRFIETFDDEMIGLQDFLDNISLLNKRDERTNLNECIKLMTLHSSKGLEFKYVFIICALDGIIPNERSIGKDQIEEERRLMYVGITRAKEHLYITASPFFGYSAFYGDISRFVKEAGIRINNLSNRDSLYMKNMVNNLSGANENTNINVNYCSSNTPTTNNKTSIIKSSGTNNHVEEQNNFNFYIEIILTALLGWLGAHCFYKKQYIKAIIYMLTFGLFGIGWLIDLILLFIKIDKTSKK